MALCASTDVMAASYNYKAAPVTIEIEDLSSKYLNEFKLIITQRAKNTTEYSKQTLYSSVMELYLYPDEHTIAGTFSSKDGSIGEYSFVQYNSNYRFLNMQAESYFTIESRGGDKFAITGGKMVVKNNAGNIYTYNYCYAEADLNNPDAPVTAFEFTFQGAPLPETWDNIGTSLVTDSVVSSLLGNASDAAPYGVTTLQNEAMYKFVSLFGNDNPAYRSIVSGTDAGSYTSADITVDVTDPENVSIARQRTGWTNGNSGYDYFLTASGGRFIEGMIVFTAADCTIDEDGHALETPAGGLTFVMPGTPLEFDTIAVTAVDCNSEYFPDSKEWMVTMHDADGSLYGFDIYAPKSGLENGKRYSSRNRDFNTDFTYAWIGEDPDYAIRASFVRTETDNEINVTAEMATENGRLYQISYSFKNEWGEWEPFKPFGISSGIYSHTLFAESDADTEPIEAVMVRTNIEDTNHRQILMKGWGAEFFGAPNDVIADWFVSNDSCVFNTANTGVSVGMQYPLMYYDVANVYVDIPSTSHYDPETATFTFHLVAAEGQTVYLTGEETLQMGGEVPQSVEEIPVLSIDGAHIFDLGGRPVNKPANGRIYIINGIKTLSDTGTVQ